MDLSESKYFSRKIEDKAHIEEIAKDLTNILGYHKINLVNFVIQEKFEIEKCSNQCPGKNFVYLKFHMKHQKSDFVTFLIFQG